MTGITEAVQAGHRQGLEALRDELASALSAADVAVKAQIAGQLRAVLKDLAALPAAAEVSKADELANRRTARRAGTGADASASRRRQPRRSG